MYLHIDCNTFFASCEVATREGLEGKPVVVANDNEAGGGIILALTPEAKALGLKRGMPMFKVRNMIRLNGVVVCQADHKKYHRISNLIMQEVQQQEIVQDFVQYSVDEFFGWLPVEEPNEVRHYVRMVKERITERSGIPVSCGCSQSYTLAKLATHFAKTFKGYEGICVLPPDKREKALAMTPIAEVWGIGRKQCKKLIDMGIATALDFVESDERQLQRLLTTTGMRTWRELQGTPSIELRNRDRKQSIAHSRTFAYMTDSLPTLEQYVRGYAAATAATLREQHSVCRTVTVFLCTNRHRADLPQYRNGATTKRATATADSTALIKQAIDLLRSIYRTGYQYKQAGVILSDISQEQGMQLDLFSEPDDARRRRLMQVADALNKKFGDDTISFGNP